MRNKVVFCIVLWMGGFAVGWLLHTPYPSTTLETSEKPALASLPVTVKAVRPDFEIAEVSSRITEKNNVFWRYAWKVKLKNASDRQVTCSAMVEFYDKEGYMVHDDNSISIPFVVEAGETALKTGMALIPTEIAWKVDHPGVKTQFE